MYSAFLRTNILILLVFSLVKIFMSGKWLQLVIGQECSQCSLLALMENLLFDYRGLEKNHKIWTEFLDVAESNAAVLGWVCLKIVLDIVKDMVSF